MRAIMTIAVLAAAMLPWAASAQDNNDTGLPTVRTVACEQTCANSTPAVTTGFPLPPWPSSLQRDGDEGYVQLSYTVGTDGVIKDVTLLRLVGSRLFADAATTTLQQKIYKPATLNGQPVEQTRTINFSFDLKGIHPGGRRDAVAAYDTARSQIKDQKLDEALKTLSDELARPELNFYERGLLDNLVALIALNKKDYLSVLNAVELPTEYFADSVEPEVLKNMIRYRIIADIGINDIDDAIRTVEQYKKIKGYDPADSLLKLVEDARVKADALPQIATLRRIPALDESDAAYFVVSRRTFNFTIVSGSLDKFKLNCRQQTIESQITDKAEWHVPKDWDRCFLTVLGAPGTVFQINQFTG